MFSFIARFAPIRFLPRPLALARVPAGFPSPAEDYIDRQLDLNEFIEHPAATFFFRLEGDSMEPLLRSGDEIFVDRNKRGGEGVFVVRIGDALHVKQVQSRGPGDIALISANDAYAPIELAREEIEVIGRVVWKGGRL